MRGVWPSTPVEPRYKLDSVGPLQRPEAKGEIMKSVLRWCVVPLLAGTLVAQTAAKPRAKKAAAKPAQPAVTLQDIQSLKDALAAQQQQIEQHKQAEIGRASCRERV